jgi:hypothetical protein
METTNFIHLGKIGYHSHPSNHLFYCSHHRRRFLLNQQNEISQIIVLEFLTTTLYSK